MFLVGVVIDWFTSGLFGNLLVYFITFTKFYTSAEFLDSATRYHGDFCANAFPKTSTTKSKLIFVVIICYLKIPGQNSNFGVIVITQSLSKECINKRVSILYMALSDDSHTR